MTGDLKSLQNDHSNLLYAHEDIKAQHAESLRSTAAEAETSQRRLKEVDEERESLHVQISQLAQEHSSSTTEAAEYKAKWTAALEELSNKEDRLRDIETELSAMKGAMKLLEEEERKTVAMMEEQIKKLKDRCST